MSFVKRLDIVMDHTEEIPTVALNGTTMRFESADDAKFVFDVLNEVRRDCLGNELLLSRIKKELSELTQRITYDE